MGVFSHARRFIYFAFQVDVDLLGAKLVKRVDIFSGFKFGRKFEVGFNSDVDGIEQSSASCITGVRVHEERGYPEMLRDGEVPATTARGARGLNAMEL